MKNQAIAQFLSTGAIIIFFVFILVFLVLSLVLNYHWTRYGVSPKNLEKVRFLYFGFAFFLFVIMAISMMVMLR